MAAEKSSKGPIVGLILLVGLIGLVVVGLQFLKSDPKNDDLPSTGSSETARKDPSAVDVDRTVIIPSEPEVNPTGTSFTVVCMGPAGSSEPLAGVEVHATPMVGAGRKADLKISAKTDERGFVAFEDLEFKAYIVEARPDGRYQLMVRDVNAGEKVTMVWEPTVSLTGTVVSAETREPLKDVYIQLRSALKGDQVAAQVAEARRLGKDTRDVEGYQVTHPFLAEVAFSADNGSFAFPAVPIGYVLKVQFTHPTHDYYEYRLNTRDGEDVAREFVLVPRTEIYGKVIDDLTSEPVPNALVILSEGGIPLSVYEQLGQDGDFLEALSDSEGNYQITNVSRGKQMVHVNQEGYYLFQESLDLKQLEPFEFNIRLSKGASLAGRVMDSAGRPIEEAKVYWVHPEELLFKELNLGQKDPFVTGPDGAFKFDDVPPERPFHVIATHENYMEGLNKDIVVQSGENQTGIEVFMNRGGEISGIVMNANREPVAGAFITARCVRPPRPALPKVETAEDGTFVLKNTPTGTYQLVCEAEGYCEKKANNVKDIATGVEFFLLKESLYKGVVLNEEDSEPIKKFRIRAHPSEDTNHVLMRTDTFREDDGSFELAGLLPGPWDFEFTAEGRAPMVLRNVSMQEGQALENQQIRMRAGAAAVGRVLSTSGRPIEGCLVRFEHLESFSAKDKTYLKLQTKAGAGGNFELPNLVPGRYECWATHPGYAQPTPKEVTILDGPVTNVDIVLQRPATLRLIVRDQDGNVPPKANVMLFQGRSPMEQAEKTVVDGAIGVSFRNPMEKSGLGDLSDASSMTDGLKTMVPESGELVWSRKEPGDWTIWVRSVGYNKYIQRITLISGKEVIHEAVIEKIKEGEKAKPTRGRRNNKKNDAENPESADGSGGGPRR